MSAGNALFGLTSTSCVTGVSQTATRYPFEGAVLAIIDPAETVYPVGPAASFVHAVASPVEFEIK